VRGWAADASLCARPPAYSAAHTSGVLTSSTVTAGRIVVVTITPKDASNATVVDGGLSFTGVFRDAATAEVIATVPATFNSPNYFVSTTLLLAKNYTITLTDGASQALKNSPLTLVIAPGACVGGSSLLFPFFFWF
jgi:hypothetical protein